MTRHRLSLPVSIVKQYTLDVIRRRMPPIQLRVAGQHTTPFPKDRSRLKSFYKCRSRSLSHDRRVRLRGGVVRLVAMLFDFTFVRSLFASKYSTRGGHCYDPASLFVLLIFAFVADLHDPCRGHQYHTFAGIDDEHIPQEADFTNFIQRCRPLFDLVFHTIVEIVGQAGFISSRALTTDGTLVPTRSRYRGCNYFDTPTCRTRGLSACYSFTCVCTFLCAGCHDLMCSTVGKFCGSSGWRSNWQRVSSWKWFSLTYCAKTAICTFPVPACRLILRLD